MHFFDQQGGLAAFVGAVHRSSGRSEERAELMATDGRSRGTAATALIGVARPSGPPQPNLLQFHPQIRRKSQIKSLADNASTRLNLYSQQEPILRRSINLNSSASTKPVQATRNRDAGEC